MNQRMQTHTAGLNSRQAELISKASVTPTQILSHLDALNEEISESYDQAKLPEDAIPTVFKQVVPPTTKPIKEKQMPVESLDAQLEAEVKAAEKMLAAKKAELAAKAAEEVAEKKAEPVEQSPEEQQKQAVLELLAKTPNAPTQAQINALKAQYGTNAVHMLALGEGDIYIFTYLKRGQWQHLQRIVQAAVETNSGINSEELMKEKVLQYTVLWPKGISSPEFITNSRAGVVDTLYQMILLNSYFLTPQQAMMFTVQL